MLHIYSGPHAALSEAHQIAVAELTARRYLDDFLPPSAHVLLAERGEPKPPWLAFDEVRAAMLRYGDGVRTCAMFAEAGDRVVAIATHRFTPGGGPDVPLTLCDGGATCSLPTSRNFLGLNYPRLPNFDPDVLGERDMAELGRICKLTRHEIAALVSQGLIDEREAQYANLCALPEVTANISDSVVEQTQAYIMAMTPKVARGMATMGYKFILLYTEGIKPHLQDFPENSLMGLYFSCYARELEALQPGIVARLGVSGAIAALHRAHPRFGDFPLVLPLLLLNDEALCMALANLRAHCAGMEARLQLEGRIVHTRELAYA